MRASVSSPRPFEGVLFERKTPDAREGNMPLIDPDMEWSFKLASSQMLLRLFSSKSRVGATHVICASGIAWSTASGGPPPATSNPPSSHHRHLSFVELDSQPRFPPCRTQGIPVSWSALQLDSHSVCRIQLADLLFCHSLLLGAPARDCFASYPKADIYSYHRCGGNMIGFCDKSFLETSFSF